MFGWGLKVKGRRLVNVILNTTVPQRKVDFIIVGAQKAGTTAIDRYLRNHSQVSMAVRKEVHFFDEDAPATKELGEKKYHSYFGFWKQKDRYGEATPCYMASLGAIDRIVAYNADIKLIVSLRDPIDRAYSAWNMERQRGREVRSFHAAIKDEVVDMTTKSGRINFKEYYLGRSLYAAQLENIFALVPASQVLVVSNERLLADGDREYARICSFLNIHMVPALRSTIHARGYERQISNEERGLAYEFLEQDVARVKESLQWADIGCWSPACEAQKKCE